MDLAPTVRPPETTFGLGDTGNEAIRPRLTSKKTLNIPQWAGGSYFRSPKTTSGRKTTVSGLTSGRPLTSVALCTGLLATTRRIRTLRAADGRFAAQPEVEIFRKPPQGTRNTRLPIRL